MSVAFSFFSPPLLLGFFLISVRLLDLVCWVRVSFFPLLGFLFLLKCLKKILVLVQISLFWLLLKCRCLVLVEMSLFSCSNVSNWFVFECLCVAPPSPPLHTQTVQTERYTDTHARTRARAHTRTHANTHTHTYTHTYTLIYTHTHTHTHTHTLVMTGGCRSEPGGGGAGRQRGADTADTQRTPRPARHRHRGLRGGHHLRQRPGQRPNPHAGHQGTQLGLAGGECCLSSLG